MHLPARIYASTCTTTAADMVGDPEQVARLLSAILRSVPGGGPIAYSDEVAARCEIVVWYKVAVLQVDTSFVERCTNSNSQLE